MPDESRTRTTPLGTAVVPEAGAPELARLTSLAAELTGAPCVILTLVHEERVVQRSMHITPGTLPPPTGLPFGSSLGAVALRRGGMLVLEDARRDPEFASHPAVTELGVVAYAAVPIDLEDGTTVGVLAIADAVPRAWDTATLHGIAAVGSLAAKEVALRAQRAQRAEAEEALRASERRYRHLVEASHAGICAVDRVGRITFANARLGEMLQRPAAELVGTSFFDLSTPEDAHAARTRFARRQRGLAEEVDVPLRRADGTPLWVRMSVSSTFTEDGEFDGAIHMLSDVTEARALAAQLRQSQKLEAVGRLAGGVAHDVNNLVQVISACATLIGEELPAASPAFADLAEIEHASQRAASLTRQLLAFSRKQQLQPRLLALNDVVAGVDRMLRRLIGADVEVDTRLDATLPPVWADRGQLEQVVMNLAINARDAMPDGGTLTLSTTAVHVTPRDAAADPDLTPGTWLQLEVRDTGTGMDDATRARIFEPFFTTKEQGKGTGLGLATVYGIVRQSGGVVRVQSAPGRGATFQVLLPPAPTSALADRPDGAPAPRPRATGRILLVEDDALVRQTTRRLLERGGHVVIEARNGAEALDRLDRDDERVDLVLTDVVMPELGGAALLARLRDGHPDVAVLVMSGYSNEALARHPGGAEGIVLLHKPFTMTELLDRVEEMLGARAGGRRLAG